MTDIKAITGTVPFYVVTAPIWIPMAAGMIVIGAMWIVLGQACDLAEHIADAVLAWTFREE